MKCFVFVALFMYAHHCTAINMHRYMHYIELESQRNRAAEDARGMMRVADGVRYHFATLSFIAIPLQLPEIVRQALADIALDGSTASLDDPNTFLVRYNDMGEPLAVVPPIQSRKRLIQLVFRSTQFVWRS